MALDSFSFWLNILRMNRWNLTKFCICIDIDKIGVGIGMCQIAQISNRLMALDHCQNFVSAQYLKNE